MGKLLLVVVAALAALTCAACGGGAPSPSGTATGQSRTVATTAAERSDAGAEAVRDVARGYRRSVQYRDPIAEIHLPGQPPRPVLAGLDQETVDLSPAWHHGTGLPGEGRLVYFAGHNRTRGGPFGPVWRIRRGELVTVRTVYATVTYEVSHRELVDERDFARVMRSPPYELLRLQTSTIPVSRRRLIVSARRVAVVPR